jgi:cell division protein FtsI/penicillin-binding protein 2
MSANKKQPSKQRAQQSVQDKRLIIMMWVVITAGAIVVIRLFSLQVIDTKEYKDRAERQYVTPTGTVFDRGSIYFTSKDGTTVAAATIEDGFKAAIIPAQVTDPEAFFKAFSEIIPLDHTVFFQKIAKKNDPYEEIADHITSEQGASISALKLPGLTLYREKWRVYPGGSLAAKALGFVSYKGNSLVGNYGLEEFYNDVLSRTTSNSHVNFFAEIFANVQSTVFKNDTASGDVVTSIEPTVQAQLESVVSEIQTKWSSDAVGGIVMDPYTGEIIAMAQVPTFDLNSFGSEKDVGVYKNTFSQNVYEMGSIIKPLVMSSAVDAGVVTPQTSYFDAGFVKVGDKTINNFDKKGRGHATMQDVLNQSLNSGMVFVEQHMGQAMFSDYMLNRFKIGEKTGVDLPSEVTGLVGNLKHGNEVNFANAAFGQGIALSPLSIVRGFAVLANGGFMVTPHLATSIIGDDGSVHTLPFPKAADPILKPETVATMETMLTHVVDDGYHRGLPRYTVAAKTGTAQIAKPNGQGYYTDRNLHSLIGFFPATKPRFVLYLYNVYPKGGTFANVTLGDQFFSMVQFLTSYYAIPPDR